MAREVDLSEAGNLQLLRIPLAEGIALHYLEQGNGNDTVVLLHGGMGDCLSWRFLLDDLAPYFHVVSYSRRHHFPNVNLPIGTSHSSRTEAQDLSVFLRLLACGPVHLIGTSYGALTAMTFAIEDPGQVRSLVLVEPPVLQWIALEASGTEVLDDFMRDVWHNAKEHFAQDRPQRAMQTLYDGLRGSGAFASLDPRRRTGIMRNAQAMEMLARSNEPFPYLDKGKAAALDKPILLVGGQQTVPIHQRGNEIMATALPGAERATIQRAGHAPASENPREFNALIRRFLTSI